MLYPNSLQAALLFDHKVEDLEAIMRDFTRIEGMRSGAIFHLAEDNRDRLYRLFNAAEELTVTFEYYGRPANAHAFEAALASPFTSITTPDIRGRIACSQSYLVLEVSHGAKDEVENNPKTAPMMDATDCPPSGATQPQFERRLRVLALMARVAIEHAMPQAVHWSPSDLLLQGEVFDDLAADTSVPGPLHIHPLLFGPQPAPGEEALMGIRTFGARHWLGREIIIQPNVLPWSANFETILAFAQAATMPNGYVIPDGETFGPKDRLLSYRVIHHDAGADIGDGAPADVPLYELVPVKHLTHRFVAHDHAFPADIMPADEDAKLAEGIGGGFAVRPTKAVDAPPSPPIPIIARKPSPSGLPKVSGAGPRLRVFGRKGL